MSDKDILRETLNGLFQQYLDQRITGKKGGNTVNIDKKVLNFRYIMDRLLPLEEGKVRLFTQESIDKLVNIIYSIYLAKSKGTRLQQRRADAVVRYPFRDSNNNTIEFNTQDDFYEAITNARFGDGFNFYSYNNQVFAIPNRFANMDLDQIAVFFVERLEDYYALPEQENIQQTVREAIRIARAAKNIKPAARNPQLDPPLPANDQNLDAIQQAENIREAIIAEPEQVVAEEIKLELPEEEEVFEVVQLDENFDIEEEIEQVEQQQQLALVGQLSRGRGNWGDIIIRPPDIPILNNEPPNQPGIPPFRMDRNTFDYMRNLRNRFLNNPEVRNNVLNFMNQVARQAGLVNRGPLQIAAPEILQDVLDNPILDAEGMANTVESIIEMTKHYLIVTMAALISGTAAYNVESILLYTGMQSFILANVNRILAAYGYVRGIGDTIVNAENVVRVASGDMISYGSSVIINSLSNLSFPEVYFGKLYSISVHIYNSLMYEEVDIEADFFKEVTDTVQDICGIKNKIGYPQPAYIFGYTQEDRASLENALATGGIESFGKELSKIFKNSIAENPSWFRNWVLQTQSTFFVQDKSDIRSFSPSETITPSRSYSGTETPSVSYSGGYSDDIKKGDKISAPKYMIMTELGFSWIISSLVYSLLYPFKLLLSTISNGSLLGIQIALCLIAYELQTIFGNAIELPYFIQALYNFCQTVGGIVESVAGFSITGFGSSAGLLGIGVVALIALGIYFGQSKEVKFSLF